ncbi:hypothetical protein GNX18_13715 [Microbulbifer sp. SH-1]|uniref:hypothetical protein n=1 Tax=Microbulbifer sp. SH-1 TaxID=2681547 RepID=UPI001408EEF9|nr:hypothetical protein [Microbulbifer sp. SH-1]QIL90702.1 hypothetical protein GNX18_13715 [Microbulbifer sp. SH-1]
MKRFILILHLFFCVSCTSDYDESLGNGYFFVATNKNNHYIVKNDRMIVGSNVSKYKMFGIYTVGYREKPTKPDTNVGSSEKYGYFILNISDGLLVEGLSKDAYLRKIEQFGIAEARVLSK